MAHTYEEALEIFNKYKDYLICVISDVKFPREGEIDDEAGIKLLKNIKSVESDIPFVFQSSDPEFEKISESLNVAFINKNSGSLANDLTNFIQNNLSLAFYIPQ
jgi:two-component SAPR family response regulator